MRKNAPLFITLILLAWGFWQSGDFAKLAAGVAIFLLGMQFLEQGFALSDPLIFLADLSVPIFR